MIRQKIIERLKKNNSPAWPWKNYNDLWNDLKYTYGTTKEAFQIELNLLVNEGKLFIKNTNEKYPTYYLSEEFIKELGIDTVLVLYWHTRERSPIIQDGKLIGAVTHVFVNDPTKGYGIFIENMLEVAE